MNRGADRHSTQIRPVEAVEIDPNLGEPPASLTSAPAAATPYHSLPLATPKSTRVLRILPPELQDGDNITCQLEVISLNDEQRPAFCALSYVWGSPTETRCITVNNELFVVRKNLWVFLDCMRKQGFQDLLWIDAVCINQDCIPERNHQVAVMGDIFRTATRVLAWLGPESTIASPDWEGLTYSGGATPRTESLLHIPIFDSIRLIMELSKPVRSGVCTSIWIDETFRITALLLKHLKDIFNAEYWKRMWIVQEYILARDISVMTDRSQMTGNEILTAWNTFCPEDDIYRYMNSFSGSSYSMKRLTDHSGPRRHRHLAKKKNLPVLEAAIDDLREEASHAFRMVQFSEALEIMERREDLHSASRIAPFEVLIEICQDMKCFDPRDHVYALLSLTKPDDLAFYELSPDYSKSALLLYIQLGYGAQMRGDYKRSFLFGNVLGIDAPTVLQVFDKVRERALLDRSLGRQSSPEKVAEEIAPLIIPLSSKVPFTSSGINLPQSLLLDNRFR